MSDNSGRPRMIVRRQRPAVGARRPRTAQRPAAGVIGAPASRRLSGRQWLIRGVILGVAALALGAFLAAWFSPLFEVNHVSIEGNSLVASDDIVARSGLLGANLLRADLGAAQERLYQLPLVKSVHIEREWPGGVRISIVERMPWGTWEQSGVRYTIDSEGVVLGFTPPPDGSPVIRSAEPGTRLQGDRVDYQAVAAAAELYEKLPAQLGTAVTEVAFLPGKGVQVTTADGQSAILGDSSSIEYKLAVWAAMARAAREEHISYTTIDLRFGNRPVLQ
jgi:cell division protein FtsQ